MNTKYELELEPRTLRILIDALEAYLDNLMDDFHDGSQLHEQFVVARKLFEEISGRQYNTEK